MRSETRIVFLAFDEREFSTERECLIYEREHSGHLLIGMTAEQLAAAMQGADSERAAALERAGYAIRRARQQAGRLKRRSRNGPQEPAAAPSEPPIDPDSFEDQREGETA